MKLMRLNATFVILGLFLVSSIAGSAKNSKPSEQEPAVVSAAAPNFAAIALAAGIARNGGGSVIVEVKIDAKGVVTSAEVESGHPLLKGVSVFAAKHWRFVESTDTKKVRTARLTFIFIQLNDKPKHDEPFELVTFTPPYQVEVRKYVEIVNTTNY